LGASIKWGKQKMSLPLVSICIPVYNAEPYIYKTLNSALNQTYKNLEIIIFDNCSTDRTAEIIKSFSDSRITYHLNDKNYGPLVNFRKCIESGNGDFILILNADDLLKPNAIEMQADALINNPDVSLCITATNVINEFDNIIMKRQLYKKTLKLNGRKTAKRSLMRGRNIYGESSTILFRKDKSQAAGDFSDEILFYSGDLDYWMRLSYVGDVYYINEFLSGFRISSTNTTSAIFSRDFKLLLAEWDNLLKKHLELNVIKLNRFDILISRTAVRITLFLKLVFLVYNNMRTKIKNRLNQKA
jgi:glycosyltransferase involved in cell wall biosynthesis